MSHVVRQPDPLRRPAIACGLLAGLAILFAAFAPKAQLPAPAGPPEASVTLRFEDQDGGIVLVSDAASGEALASLGVGEGGFVRATVRGLAAARKRNGFGDETPFELSRFADGRLQLRDPDTDRTISLFAFGHDNAAAFGAFIDQRREPL
jgi:putative photosynthetic complex assembly protein